MLALTLINQDEKYVRYYSEFIDPKSLETRDAIDRLKSKGYLVSVERGVHGWYLDVQGRKAEVMSLEDLK